jgi:hydroxypyruvate isomerase
MRQNLVPSVCIDAVFSGKSFDEACALVKEANMTHIEFWGWWDKDLDSLQAAQHKYGLSIAACCTKFISLVDPTLRDDYLLGLQESIQVAQKLGIKVLISQVGDFIESIPQAEQQQSLIDGLKAAAPLLEAADITLVIEPLNELVDHTGYFLIRSEQAFDIVKQVESPNIKVLFDIYHQQISEGNVIRNIVDNIDYIGHFHAAGNPGRNELQSGEINYPQVFSAIQKSNYSGHVGLEYWPTQENPLTALREVAAWLA